MHQRIVFPVRSNFFYDHPAGVVVNGAMAVFSMYPPIFRERERSSLNMMGLDELAWLLDRGGCMVGFHPEGTRNQGDPYQLLPARTGIGRLAHRARVPVVPVFTNGLLTEDLPKQIRSNFDGTGVPIHTVVGEPVDLADLFDEPASQSVFKRISNKIRDSIVDLGAEEAEIRAAHGA
jgi:1-acyl-sn-glycerol-3-phosphate acyltransferase